MPQLQVVDLGDDSPDPTGVEKFFSNVSKVYQDSKDKKAIEPIWEEYLKNLDDAHNYEKTQVALERSNISPTKRLEAQNKLNEMQKLINEKDKTLKAKATTEVKKSGLEKARQLVRRQREILKTGHLGPIVSGPGKTSRKWGSTFDNEGTKLRKEYERIGKALIQQASTLVIRNRAEFETLAEDLYNTDLPQEEIEGILDALDRILQEESEEDNVDISSSQKNMSVSDNKTERPPLSSFVR